MTKIVIITMKDDGYDKGNDEDFLFVCAQYVYF